MSYKMTTVDHTLGVNQSVPAICQKMFEAKVKSGLTFEKIAASLDRGEVYVASIFYGQMKPDASDITKLAEVLSMSAEEIGASLGEGYFPHRGIGQMPPTDPTIYRLYEVILVHGQSLKSIIHEKFGDGIMSAINFKIDVKKDHQNGEDRVLINLNGKWLPYTKF